MKIQRKTSCYLSHHNVAITANDIAYKVNPIKKQSILADVILAQLNKTYKYLEEIFIRIDHCSEEDITFFLLYAHNI